MINDVTLERIKEFNELGSLVNHNFVNVYMLADLIDSDIDYVYGYYINDKLVGFIHVSKLYEVVDVVNIVVASNYRRQGIASKLINYVISLFDDVDKIMLEVKENNFNAISFYQKNNFKIISKRNNYYGSDAALIMERVVENEGY